MSHSTAAPPADPAGPGHPARRAAYYTLGILVVAGFFSFLDRQLLNLLAPPIKADLHISDTDLGLLQGFAFAMFYAIMAVPFGWMADRTSRKRLAAAGVALWSAATVYSGFSDTLLQLAIARAGVGLGEATLMPVAYSLLADCFPPRQRGRAFALFSMGSLIGSSSALLAGGIILKILGGLETVVLPVIGQIPVWKAAFIVCGLPGFLVAPMLLTIPEPARARPPVGVDTPKGMSIFAYVRARPAAFFYVWTLYSVLAMLSFAVTPWTPMLLVRQHGIPLGTVGLAVGLCALAGGIFGAATSGWISDRLVARNVPAGRLKLTMVWWIGVIPALLLLTLGHSPAVAITGLLLFTFLNTIVYVGASAVIQDMVPSALRGRTTAFWYLITGLIGNGLGPLTTGLVTDHVLHDEQAIRYSILIVTIPAAIIGLTATLLALKPYERARKEAQAAAGAAPA